MTFVKRLLWTAAWSAWLWLGFGLYRELPRKPAAAVCELSLRGGIDDIPLGFAGDSDRFMVARNLTGRLEGPKAIELYDADAGTVHRRIAIPPEIGFDDFMTLRYSRRFGVLFVRHHS